MSASVGPTHVWPGRRAHVAYVGAGMSGIGSHHFDAVVRSVIPHFPEHNALLGGDVGPEVLEQQEDPGDPFTEAGLAQHSFGALPSGSIQSSVERQYAACQIRCQRQALVLGAVAMKLRSPAAVDHDTNFALFFVAVMRSRNFRAANGLDTLLGSVCRYVTLPFTIFCLRPVRSRSLSRCSTRWVDVRIAGGSREIQHRNRSGMGGILAAQRVGVREVAIA